MRTHYNRLRIGTWVDGTYTEFGAYNNYNVPAGAYVTFQGGITGGLRVFRLLVNNQIKLTTTDTSNVSYVGSSYRHCGWTLNTDGEYRPNNMSVWTMNDNAPVITAGVGYFRAYRTNTSATTSAMDGVFRAYNSNTLDTVDEITADMTWDSPNQTLTVNTAGRYIVSMREGRTADAPADGCDFTLGVFHTKGGVTKQWHGPGEYVPNVNDSGSVYNDIRTIGGSPLILNCTAGDQIRFAHRYNNPNQTTITFGPEGDSNGYLTWAQVAKVG